MKELQSAKEGDVNEIVQNVQAGKSFKVKGYEVAPEDVLITKNDKAGWVSAADADYAVRIDTRLSAELLDQGLARELVHRIQTMRRTAGFEITDRITTWYQGDERTARVMQAHADYIQQETLSTTLCEGEPDADAYMEEQKVDGVSVTLAVKRA